MTRHIIVGGGPAATNAIETIRQFDNGESQICWISDEVPHSRMALPYWLSGQIQREQTFTSSDAYCQQLKVDTRFGQRVDAIDPNARSVETSDHERLEYENLLLATGSNPLTLPVSGGDLSGVTPKWTLDHVETGLAILNGKTRPRVVLVGAGFIGFIILSALYKRGCQITVVEREPHVLPKMMSAVSADFVERWLGDKGVRVLTSTSVREIKEARATGATGSDSKIVDTDREALEADLVVVAVGVRPNTQLAEQAGLDVDHGILVDDHVQTSNPHIFAAGDCAQGVNLLGGDREVHAIHPTAVDHGRIAGANMAGQDIVYPGSLSMNVLDICGLQCVSYGNWGDAASSSMEISSAASNVYRNLLWTGDRITGAMFVGQANNVGMLTDVGMVKGLIQTQTSLGPWKDHLASNPHDIRRAYIGSGVAAKLAATTLLGRPAKARQFHFGDAAPTTRVSPHHGAYMGTKSQ